MYRSLLVLFFITFFLAIPTSVNLAAADKIKLKVALYPYIPEPQKFFDWIEQEFEKKNPDIELVIRPAKASDLSYNTIRASVALTNERHSDYQHIIEIDTLILSNLVAAEAIQKFSIDRKDFFNFALRAVTIGEVIYGVPHWTCGNFIITTHKSVANAKNAIELRDTLRKLGTPAPDLGGDLEGSYTSIVVYLDALFDTNSNVDINSVLDDTVMDPLVVPYISALSDACNSSGTSMCNKEEGMTSAFAHGVLDSFIGYSERLNKIFSEPIIVVDKSKIKITPAPLGGGKENFLFTDALVLSKKCSSKECKRAARRFAEFYVSDDVMEGAMMGKGQKLAVPRYLLPSTLGAFSTPLVSKDIFYTQLLQYMQVAEPYPNTGIPLARSLGKIREFMGKRLNHEK